MQTDHMISRFLICCRKSSIDEPNTLPFTTELLTRNVKLIKTINRLEHGVSYTKLPAIHCVKSFRIQSECRKIRTIKTPNTDTFHAVINTAFTREKSAETESLIAFPTKTYFRQQTILVYDNINRF